MNYPGRYYQIPFGGQLFQNTTKSSSYMLRLQADWHKYLTEKHFVSVMGGYELSSARTEGISEQQRGYFKDRGQSFDDRTIPSVGPNLDYKPYERYYNWLIGNHPTYTNTLTNMVSAFATASYVFDNRYIFNINARSDWSNAFGSRSREKFFPVWSVSGRWNISDEPWLKRVAWVDMLALRASYGIQGNMLGNQPSRLIIARQPGGAAGESSATIVSVANPDLRWEKTHSYNVGMDFALLGDKVRGSFSYYYKRTKDAFLTRRVASQNGYTEYVVNAGDIENRGVELGLSFTPIDRGVTNGKRNFVWRIDPQIGQALNQLINRAINRSNDFLQDEPKLTDLLMGAAVLPGTALNSFYSFNYAGLDNAGRPTFYGLEADREAELNAWYSQLGADDKKNVWMSLVGRSGTRVPVLQGSVRNYFGWRNWGLSLNMTYSLGAKVRLFNLASGAYSGVKPLPHQNVKEDFVNRWQHEGDEAFTNVPGLAAQYIGQGNSGDIDRVLATYGWWYNAAWAPDEIKNGAGGLSKYGMYDLSDLRVVSANYLRLQSVSLSYTLGYRVTQKLGIQRANFAFTAQNLFTIASKKLSGQNPDQFGATGVTNIALRPQYTISLNLNF